MRREAAKNRSQQNPNEQELKNWGQPGRSQTAQVGTFLNLVFLLLICQIDCCKPGSSLEFTKLILWSNKHLDKERVDKPWFSRVFREVFQVREEAGQRTLRKEWNRRGVGKPRDPTVVSTSLYRAAPKDALSSSSLWVWQSPSSLAQQKCCSSRCELCCVLGCLVVSMLDKTKLRISKGT